MNISSEVFLTLLLDTPFSNPGMANYLLGKSTTTVREDYLGLSIIVSGLWKGLTPTADPCPAVCINCRTYLGSIKGEVFLRTCHNCSASGKITDSRKAVERLLLIFQDARVESISPILRHLESHPLPSACAELLKNKKLAG